MKIIIDARWIRSINLDGIANFTLNTTIELLKYKENHYLILVNSNEIKALVQKYLKDKNTRNFDFLITPIAITSLKNYYLLPQIIAEYKPEIFFSPCYSFLSLFTKKVKHIGVVHDLIPIIFSKMFKKASFKFKIFYCNKLVQKISLSFFYKIISVSKSTKKDLQTYLSIHENKITVITEGFSLKENELVINKLPFEYFLFVGRHEYYKNIAGLINSYHLLDKTIKEQYKLIIIGKFNNKVTNDLKSLINTLKEENNIIFIEFATQEELATYYKKAKMLIHLSLYEGFGLTVLEAMGYGIPVIASNTSSIPEVVGDAALLVEPKNYLQVKEHIEKLLYNEELRADLIKSGLERVKTFTWSITAEQLIKIFEKD